MGSIKRYKRTFTVHIMLHRRFFSRSATVTWCALAANIALVRQPGTQTVGRISVPGAGVRHGTQATAAGCHVRVTDQRRAALPDGSALSIDASTIAASGAD